MATFTQTPRLGWLLVLLSGCSLHTEVLIPSKQPLLSALKWG